MNIEAALHYLRPGAAWTLYGNTYNDLLWQDAQQIKPTETEVVEAMLLPAPIEVPQEVAMWALKELCLVRGHAVAVESALGNLPEPVRTIARNRWENKDTISRGSSIIAAMQAILGWSDSYVDELFVESAKL